MRCLLRLYCTAQWLAFGLLLSLMLTSGGAAAAEGSSEPEVTAQDNQTATGQWQFSLAAGYGELENPLALQPNPSSVLLPSWHYYAEKFYLDNFNLGYSLLESSDLEVDVQTRLNEDGLFFELNGLSRLLVSDLFNRFPVRNDKQLPAYANIERKVSYLAGLQLNFPTPLATISLGHFHDISGVHNGAESVIRVNRIFSLGNSRLGLEAGWTRKNQALVDYYYKLTPAELAFLSTRQHVRASQNYHLRLVLNLPISAQWYWLLTAEHNWLGQGIRRSFLVNKAQYSVGFVGIGYDF